jgi:hypothetical protein
MRYGRLGITGVVFLVVLFFGFAAFAGKAVWVYGEVTQAPHQIDERTYIQVDGTLYRIPPDTPVLYRYERRRDAFNEREASLYAIGKYQDIAMFVQDYKVLKIFFH